jgi:hypothetical protein
MVVSEVLSLRQKKKLTQSQLFFCPVGNKIAPVSQKTDYDNRYKIR